MGRDGGGGERRGLLRDERRGFCFCLFFCGERGLLEIKTIVVNEYLENFSLLYPPTSVITYPLWHSNESR